MPVWSFGNLFCILNMVYIDEIIHFTLNAWQISLDNTWNWVYSICMIVAFYSLSSNMGFHLSDLDQYYVNNQSFSPISHSKFLLTDSYLQCQKPQFDTNENHMMKFKYLWKYFSHLFYMLFLIFTFFNLLNARSYLKNRHSS